VAFSIGEGSFPSVLIESSLGRFDPARRRRAEITDSRELGRHIIDSISGYACRESDRPRVKAHVSALNPLGGERTKRAEVLGEADRRHDHRELLRRVHAEKFP
jgi:hypothetical protein